MNKNIFKDYIDACELEKELEERIRKLEEAGTAPKEYHRLLKKIKFVTIVPKKYVINKL